MNGNQLVIGYIAKSPRLSAAVYVALVASLLLIDLILLAGLLEPFQSVGRSEEILSRLEQRTRLSPAMPGGTAGNDLPGSPYLEGATLTVASAALLQRITSAVSRSGGSVVSSEVAPQRSQSKDDAVSVVVSCDIDQIGLQQLLYDIEANMPFLFTDQLTVQASTLQTKALRVVLTISGQWRGTK